MYVLRTPSVKEDIVCMHYSHGGKDNAVTEMYRTFKIRLTGYGRCAMLDEVCSVVFGAGCRTSPSPFASDRDFVHTISCQHKESHRV